MNTTRRDLSIGGVGLIVGGEAGSRGNSRC
jgi:hypothetical protein